jgi:hypothetical protein
MTLAYSDAHIKRLQEFFAEPERNRKLRSILGDFPEPKTITQLGKAELERLHLRVIKKLIQDIYLSYSEKLTKWAEVTKQTAIVDPEYISMHLVSIFTGIPGSGTAARGYDLGDGSEVKSCSRVEQLGKCKRCRAGIMMFEEKCWNCGSTEIERKFDSHWIFSLRTDKEVKDLLSRPIIYLLLLDYEDINKRDVIRIRIWGLNPVDKFVQLFFQDYYFEEFFKQKIANGKTPAPCNLHPDKPLTKFLKPLLLFCGRIDLANLQVSIELVNSNGLLEKLTKSEVKNLQGVGKGFFKKVRQLGLGSEFQERIREMTQEEK